MSTATTHLLQGTAPAAVPDATTRAAVPDKGVVRLSVNLAADVAEALKHMSTAQGMTVTQGVRKAIVLWKLITDETSKGNRVMVVEGEGSEAKYREIVIV